MLGKTDRSTPLYFIGWKDGIIDHNKVMNKTIYLILGLNKEGKKEVKEVLGLWLGKTESSSFWMTVLTDLQTRGVEGMLITCTDNLNGFSQTNKVSLSSLYHSALCCTPNPKCQQIRGMEGREGFFKSHEV